MKKNPEAESGRGFAMQADSPKCKGDTIAVATWEHSPNAASMT